MAKRLSLPALFHVHFADLPDPRVKRTRRYRLKHLLFMAFCAVLTGSNGWQDIELFVETHRPFFRRFFRVGRRTPCADTFRRVFERLQPQVFRRAFVAWAKALVIVLSKHLAIDGKSLRGVIEGTKRSSPLHLLHVWSVEQRVLLGMTKVQGAPGEPIGIKEMLDLVEVAGATVTTDANGCTQEIAAKIIQGGGEYALALKGNRGCLHAEVVAHFEALESKGFRGTRVHHSHQQGHGRSEARTVHVCRATFLPEERRAKWAGLTSVARVERTRTLANKTTTEVHVYVLSFEPDAERAARVIRNHGSIENDLHGTLDVSMGEDACRVRDMTSGENLGVLRRMALNVLKHPDAGKESLRRKQEGAKMSSKALLRLLSLGPRPEPKEAA